jgi:TRAP-type C4-dicarboxylate transport system permease small subunit
MKLESLITKLCYVLLWATTVVIFFILCANTALRFAGERGMDWASEVPELLFPWLVMSGVVLAAIHGSHITTSFLRDRLRPAHQRYLAIFVWSIVAGLYATLCIATYKMLDIVKDEKSPVLGVPGSVTYGCVMLGMFLLFVLAIKDAITAIKTPAIEIAAHNAAALPNTNY